MSEQHRSVFLERQTYRRRRLMDAAWLLPIVGLLFWTLPLLWENGAIAVPQSETTGMVSMTTTSGAMLYIFGAWFGLVVLSIWLSSRIGPVFENTPQQSGLDK